MMRIKQLAHLLFSQLQIRIIVSIVLFLFLAVSISLHVSFKQTESHFLEETSGLLNSNLELMGNRIEGINLDMMKLSNLLNSDDVILDALTGFNQGEDFSPFQRIKSERELTSADYTRISKIENHIFSVKNSALFNYDAFIAVISADGLIGSVKGNIGQLEPEFKMGFADCVRSESWFRELAGQEKNITWVVPFANCHKASDSDGQYISLARAVKSSYTGELLGMILIQVDLDTLKPLFQARTGATYFVLNETNDVFMVYGDGELQDISAMKDRLRLYGTRKGSFIGIMNDERYVMNYYILNDLHWTLVSASPYKAVMRNTTAIKHEVLTINYVAFGLFLLFSVALIVYITNPLKRLIHQLKKKKIGVYSLGTQEMTYSNDVHGIVKSFDHLFERVEELVEKVILEQKREQELKYEALKAQINPHFLFNTLNGIKWTAMMNGADTAAEMIADLGRLLEVSMNKGDEHILLKEEMELVQAYMNIQNARFNESIELHVRLPAELEHALITKLLLQPLVENSMLHGFRGNKVGGRIEIDACRLNGDILIRIQDNGEGIPPERLKTLLTAPSPAGAGHMDKFNGIGLSNIHNRLQLKYGEGYGLTITSIPGEGTCVSVLFPAQIRG